MNICKPDCIFCTSCQQEKDSVLKFTKNFYVKIGKNIVTPGHIMIIPKCHYVVMGDMENKELIEEFLELKREVIEKITKAFAAPIMCEYGPKTQSVFHAHMHFIPNSGNGYKNIDFLNNVVFPGIKKMQTPYREIKKFSDLGELYKRDRDYIYHEQNGVAVALEIADKRFTRENIVEAIGYRQYFQNIVGLKGLGSWKTMTEEDIKIDNLKAQKTRELLIF